MTISDDNKPEILDVPAFLRDPQPSKPMKCPTLLLAWLRSSSEPLKSEAARYGDITDQDDTNEDRK